jgi:hypothetical protein
MCGQGYEWFDAHLNGYPHRGWIYCPRRTSQRLVEAWTWERAAACLPRWRWLQRWHLRRFAASARREDEALSLAAE